MIDFGMHRDVQAVREAVEAGVCRHCGGARTPRDPGSICIECARCIGCRCSPTCVTRKPVVERPPSEQEESLPAPLPAAAAPRRRS